ncbi:MAG TPA: tRNA epoxyqueuosine(34) reductase QueG [Gemmatimonadaceae bacterium]|nr:tRNA epoxyqueuosine(34) reductase QueG [Gemmatimonadaceae bacterium]
MNTATAETLSIENMIKAQGYGLGFDLVGITSLGPVETASAFDAWIERGYAGEMDYLPRGAEKRRDSRLPVAGTTSAIVVGLNYGGREPTGPVARYARGDDYHDVMISKLEQLHRWLESELGYPIRGKAYVDTGPILERDLARRAGLGWFGKNTNLINPRVGSFYFIGSLLIDLDLTSDAPFDLDRCGTCTRCLDACPTKALVEPGVLDATRCVSYLTIEKRGAIPEDLREQIGTLLYGCDICQDVCPWNVSFSRELSEDAFRPREMFARNQARELAREILQLTDETYLEKLSRSAIKRAKRRGLARNAAVVLGNIGDERDIPALVEARNDSDSVVREHAEWALAKIEAIAGVSRLERALPASPGVY